MKNPKTPQPERRPARSETTMTAISELAPQFRQLPDLTVLTDEPMAAHTSFGIGGAADLLLMPRSVAALAITIEILGNNQVNVCYMGNGTNVLVRDGGIRGAVVKLAGALTGMRRRDDTIIARAGEKLSALCHRCAREGLSGLEFAAGIPGSVGGAILMNAGANGGEMADVTRWVEVITAAGELQRRPQQQIEFGYRHSSFQNGQVAIAQVAVELTPADPRQVQRALYEGVERRCQRQPVGQASAGCIFKHPRDDYAGRLLEEAQTKGMRVGGAMVSPKHANFIVNTGGATARDIVELIEQVQQKVHARFSLLLESEIRILGEDA